MLRREPGAAAGWARNYGLAVGVHALWNGTCVVAAAVGYAWFQGWEVDLLGLSDAALLVALLAAEGIGLLVALRALARRLEPSSAETRQQRRCLPCPPSGRWPCGAWSAWWCCCRWGWACCGRCGRMWSPQRKRLPCGSRKQKAS